MAQIGDRILYEDEVGHLVGAQLRQLRNQEYELKRRAIEEVASRLVVEAEARKRGTTVEKLFELEADSAVSGPTDAEVEAYYLGQRDRLNRPFEEVKEQLRQSLKQTKVQQAREAYLRRLRQQAGVTILLRPPKAEVRYDPSRVGGNPDASITIVEFSDFQCGFCRSVQGTLKELLGKYPDKVKLAYRDFPLHQMHPGAQQAAEAARCAAEQGKFWEYHDLLFANFGKLDAATLAQHAQSLRLDEKAFQDCLASSKHKAAVDADVEEGTKAGVTGTPTFFINGIFLSGAQPLAAFQKIIEDELAFIEQQHSPR